MSQKTTMCMLLAAAVALLAGAVRSGPAQTDGPLPVLVTPSMPIGEMGTEYRNPDVAVSPDGRVAIAAEAGPVGNGRLALADWAGGSWTATKYLTEIGAGDCRHPCVTYDSLGVLHVAWAQASADRYAIHYAWRAPDGQWSDGGSISATPDLDCGLPHLAVDQKGGRLWAAWQAGLATRYGIYLAWRDGASSFTRPLDITRDRSDHYNIMPRLFPDSPYRLAWYEEVGTGFELRAVTDADLTTESAIVSPIEFDRLDANQLPWLFQAPSGMLGGVWIDLVDGRDRVLVGFQGPTTRGEGLVADMTSIGDADQPWAVAVGDDTVALAWSSRQPDGSLLYVGRVDGASRVGRSRPLRLYSYGSYSRPRLAVGKGRLVHCVWFSDKSRGGTGDLFYATLLY